jgi:hypothetical protein
MKIEKGYCDFCGSKNKVDGIPAYKGIQVVHVRINFPLKKKMLDFRPFICLKCALKIGKLK